MNERLESGLRRMREHAELARTYAREHPDWHEDQLATDAIAKRVELVAEVAGYQVTSDLRAQCPEIPWTEIIGMRNRLVHGYDKLNLTRLAETVERSLP